MTKRSRWAVWSPSGTSDHFGLLVVLLIAVLLMSGSSDHGLARMAAAIVNLSTLLLGYGFIRTRERLWLKAVFVAGALVGVILVSALPPDHVGTALGATIQVIILGVLTLAVLARVFEHERVTNQTMFGAVAAYLLVGQVFAWIYMALIGFVGESVLDSGQQGELPIYYSYVVLTTLGFGDINPIGAFTQRITILEALLGQLFLAILLARLVSVYSRDEPPLRPGGGVTGPSI